MHVCSPSNRRETGEQTFSTCVSLDDTTSKSYARGLQLVVFFILHVLNLLLQIVGTVLRVAYFVRERADDIFDAVPGVAESANV